MLVGTKRSSSECFPKPYCQCWSKRAPKPVQWIQLNACNCGEDNDISEWKWEHPDERNSRSILISEDMKQVTFHPYYSSGTAAVRGDMPINLNHHYYWEVKMLTDTYGTDIMIGVGTSKVNFTDSEYRFISLLGEDSESYGLSYRGMVRHDAKVAHESPGFCKGSIVGVRVDMWRGTLEFYLNRKPQGVAFHNLRRHGRLFPMVCSTAAQSAVRLTYAASWPAALLVEAARALAAAPAAPPGLRRTLRTHFWLTLPTHGCTLEEDDEEPRKSNSVERARSVLAEVLPSQYMNGFYVDSVEPNYRLVVRQ